MCMYVICPLTVLMGMIMLCDGYQAVQEFAKVDRRRGQFFKKLMFLKTYFCKMALFKFLFLNVFFFTFLQENALFQKNQMSLESVFILILGCKGDSAGICCSVFLIGVSWFSIIGWALFVGFNGLGMSDIFDKFL